MYDPLSKAITDLIYKIAEDQGCTPGMIDCPQCRGSQYLKVINSKGRHVDMPCAYCNGQGTVIALIENNNGE